MGHFKFDKILLLTLNLLEQGKVLVSLLPSGNRIMILDSWSLSFPRYFFQSFSAFCSLLPFSETAMTGLSDRLVVTDLKKRRPMKK